MVYFPTWMVDLYGKSPKKRCCQIPEKKTSSRFGQGNLPQKFPVQFRFRKKCIWPYGILQKSIGRKIALTLQPTISVWEFLSSWGVCWSPLEVPSPRQNIIETWMILAQQNPQKIPGFWGVEFPPANTVRSAGGGQRFRCGRSDAVELSEEAVNDAWRFKVTKESTGGRS